MDYDWHSGAWYDALNVPVPTSVNESDHEEFRRQVAEYFDRCAMVLESWSMRDAQWLGDFSWGWIDYDRQLAFLRVELTEYADPRLIFWVNDFALANEQKIYVLAVSVAGEDYLREPGIAVVLKRRADVIAQLMAGGP